MSGQVTAPNFLHTGCRHPTLTPGDTFCFSASTSCLPNHYDYPQVPRKPR